MAKQKHSQTKKITNKRARFDYALDTEFVAGISLTGKETKALRLGHGHLRGSYVTIKGGEVYLINATITSFPGALIDEPDQTRARKLLLKKKEIDQLIAAKKQGATIVPLELLTSTRFIKIKIAAGKGKKLYDKRQVLKKRDETRQIQRTVRNR